MELLWYNKINSKSKVDVRMCFNKGMDESATGLKIILPTMITELGTNLTFLHK